MRRGFYLSLLCLAALATPAATQQRSIAIERFHADIQVHPDARTEIRETLEIEFRGAWNGIERDISLQHRTARGRRARLTLEVTGVTDAAGEPLRYEEERSGATRRLRIWVPGAQDATRTVVIRYQVPNALRFFEDATHREGGHDELYWNITGNDWEMPIRRASATITLPSGAEAVEAWAYTGPAGSQARDARVQVSGNEVRVAADQRLAPGEGLTVSAVWAPGVVDRGAAAAGRPSALTGRWPLALPIFAFLIGFLKWNREGRERRRGAVTVRYEPPAGLTPAEAGTLVDHRAEMHDITAMLVDLAVRGYIVIEEVRRKRFLGLRSETDYVFHRSRSAQEWNDLAEHEQLYLKGLFDGKNVGPEIMERSSEYRGALARARREAAAAGRSFDTQSFTEAYQAHSGTNSGGYRDSVKLSELKDRFWTHLNKIRDAIYTGLVEHGFYARRPDRPNGLLVMLAFGIGMAGFLVMILTLNEELLLDWWAVLLGFGGSVVILGLFSTRMRPRSLEGVSALEGVLGFREFLARVEGDRYNRMITTPELFERYLPYAMAFRVEKRWARAFEHLHIPPPAWYRGAGDERFVTTSFTRRLHRMSSRASRTMASSPSKGGRSGSGGGGRSGGGSGGGGGRGF